MKLKVKIRLIVIGIFNIPLIVFFCIFLTNHQFFESLLMVIMEFSLILFVFLIEKLEYFQTQSQKLFNLELKKIPLYSNKKSRSLKKRLKKIKLSSINSNDTPKGWIMKYSMQFQELLNDPEGYQWFADGLQKLLDGRGGLDSYYLSDALISVPLLYSLKEQIFNLLEDRKSRVAIFEETGMGKTQLLLQIAYQWSIENSSSDIYYIMCSEQITKEKWKKIYDYINTNYGQKKKNALLIFENSHVFLKFPEKFLSLIKDANDETYSVLLSYTLKEKEIINIQKKNKNQILLEKEKLIELFPHHIIKLKKNWKSWRSYLFSWVTWIKNNYDEKKIIYDERPKFIEKYQSPWTFLIYMGNKKEDLIDTFFPDNDTCPPQNIFIYFLIHLLYLLTNEEPINLPSLKTSIKNSFKNNSVQKNILKVLEKVIFNWQRQTNQLLLPFKKLYSNNKIETEIRIYHQEWARLVINEFESHLSNESNAFNWIDMYLRYHFRDIFIIWQDMKIKITFFQWLIRNIKINPKNYSIYFLDLGFLKIGHRSLELIGNLTHLTHLHLRGNKLTVLPESIGNLTNLSELHLSGNKLTVLPESIGNLTNLSKLHLSGNKLTVLPEFIGNFKNLTLIDLAGNKLTVLPESIGNLTHLTHLNLSFNKLTVLPEFIGNLTNLTYLNLKNNNLTVLPEFIGNFKNLTLIDLAGNKLTVLPEFIGNLTNLTYLSLENNNLTVLPESICKINKLKLYNFDNNPRLILSEPIRNFLKKRRKLSRV